MVSLSLLAGCETSLAACESFLHILIYCRAWICRVAQELLISKSVLIYRSR